MSVILFETPEVMSIICIQYAVSQTPFLPWKKYVPVEVLYDGLLRFYTDRKLSN